MFYILASRILLQILLHNTMIDATEEQTKDNKQDIIKYNFEDLKSKLDRSIKQYKHCEELYSELVVNFFIAHKIESTTSMYHGLEKKYSIEVLDENIYKFLEKCQKMIDDFFKEDKICKNEQIFFKYYADLLRDSAIFVLRTFVLRRDNNGKFDKIQQINQQNLIKRLNLSCNWIQKLADNTNFCVLNCFYIFTVFGNIHGSWEYFIKTNHENEISAPRVLLHVALMQDYYNTNKIVTLDEMIEIDNPDTIYQWMVGANKNKDVKIDLTIVEQIFTYVKREKSLQTQIIYLAKTKYYDHNENTEEYARTIKHEEIIKKLKLENTLPYFYKLNISAYCMYKEETINATTNIIDLINNKIEDLIKNTNIITEHLFDLIKRKIIDVVQEHKDAISINVDEVIQQIDSMHNKSVEEIVNVLEQLTVKQSSNFFSKMMEILGRNDGCANSVVIKTINKIREVVKYELLPKYTNIIKNVEELGNKKEESKKMSGDLKDNMQKVEVYTNLIGHEDLDTEDIYLGLNTINAYYENMTKSYQNERKLCELRIIEIMEKVVTYKSMIIKTERCMNDLMNGIEKLHQQNEQ